MAIVLASETIVNGGGGFANSVTLAAPSGMGTGDLDLVIATFGCGVGSSFSALSGYTALSGSPFAIDNGGSSRGQLGIWYKSADASPSSCAPAWSSYSRNYIAGRWRVTGVDLGTPINVIGTASEGAAAPSTSPTMTVAATTTTAANCMALCAFAWHTGLQGGPPCYTASGWTASGLNSFTQFASDRPSAVLFSKTIAAAGSTGTCVVDPENNADATSADWLGVIFALQADPAAVSATRRPIVVIM